MKKSVLLSVMLALPFAGLAVSAQAGNAVADVDVHVSTLGAGLGVAFPVSNSVAARVGFNQFSKSINTSTANANGSVNYTGNLKLSSFDLLADWHPFDGITHFTGGLMYNNNKFELNSTGPFTVNGTQYNAGTLNASITFNKVAPYLGFGWSGQAKNTGWSFKSDFGILFQGSPNVTLSSNNPAAAGNLATEQANLNDKLKNFKYYPVVSVGIGYAF